MVEDRSLTQKYALAALSPDGKLLAVGTNGKVLVFNDKLEQKHEITAVFQPDALQIFWSHDSTILFAYHDCYGEITEINLAVPPTTPQKEWHPKRQAKVTSMTTSPDHAFVAFGFADGVVTVFRREDQKEMQSVRIGDKPITLVRFTGENSFFAANSQGTITKFTVR
jgi:WD40 repeat protein